MKRSSITIFVILVCAVCIFLWYVFNKPGRNVTNENSITIAATELFKSYAENETNANTAYLDKAITVTGIVIEIATNQQGQNMIVLQTNDPMFGVACTMRSNISSEITKGTHVTLKGICSGFTNDVVLRDCIIPPH